MKIHFETVTVAHLDAIFDWLTKPYVIEFWDNTQGHKDDIIIDRSRKAYLVKVYDEIAGFVLLNQVTEDSANKWNMGEFFIIAKFQGQGIAYQVAKEIWNMNPGKWEVSVIPKNRSAGTFWEKSISELTCCAFNKEIKEVTYDEHCPRRVIFCFDTQSSIHKNIVPTFGIRQSQLSDIEAMVSLSKAKRLEYEKAQAVFWKYAGLDGDNTQKHWFTELLTNKDYLIFTATCHEEIIGFIIGRLVPAPEVYNPGGLTLMIDDFCIASEWFVGVV